MHTGPDTCAELLPLRKEGVVPLARDSDEREAQTDPPWGEGHATEHHEDSRVS